VLADAWRENAAQRVARTFPVAQQANYGPWPASFLSLAQTHVGQLGGDASDSVRNRPGDSDQPLIAGRPARVQPDRATPAIRSQHHSRFHDRSLLRDGCFGAGDPEMQPSSATAETSPSQPTPLFVSDAYTTAQVRFDASVVEPLGPSLPQECLHHHRMWCTHGGRCRSRTTNFVASKQRAEGKLREIFTACVKGPCRRIARGDCGFRSNAYPLAIGPSIEQLAETVLRGLADMAGVASAELAA
jgi:hypothetical protein